MRSGALQGNGQIASSYSFMKGETCASIRVGARALLGITLQRATQRLFRIKVRMIVKSGCVSPQMIRSKARTRWPFPIRVHNPDTQGSRVVTIAHHKLTPCQRRTHSLLQKLGARGVHQGQFGQRCEFSGLGSKEYFPNPVARVRSSGFTGNEHPIAVFANEADSAAEAACSLPRYRQVLQR